MNPRPLAAALLLAAAPAFAADPPVPKVMSDAPADKGAWRMEMLEMPGADRQQLQAMGRGMTMCSTAAQAMARDRADGGPKCEVKLVEDAATRAVMETRCPGSPPRTMRSTITRVGARSYEMVVEGVQPAERGPMKMRMSYAGPCSEKDSVMTLDKDSPACQNARRQLATMDPATQCKGPNREACVQAMTQARAQMQGMCPP